MGTQELAHGGIEGHQATLQGDLATLVGRWRRRRGQSAQTKHGDVVIDLDAWARATPTSIGALLVAQRAPSAQIQPGNGRGRGSRSRVYGVELRSEMMLIHSTCF